MFELSHSFFFNLFVYYVYFYLLFIVGVFIGKKGNEEIVKILEVKIRKKK